MHRLTRLPRCFDPERAQDISAQIPWAKGDTAALLSAAGSASPFLGDLIRREGAWLEQALETPEDGFAQILETTKTLPADDVRSGLRLQKRRVALLTALADLAGVWTLDEVTSALTRFADLAVDRALQTALTRELSRGKIPGQTLDDLPEACGMVVLAMGKMGAHELNYSSDIDLICVFDETRYDRDMFHEARSGLVRATRNMAAILNDVTGDGYVFRTDLRLRPDPSVTPVCLSMDAAERYYESLGRTWERAAYIKARVCAGDHGAGARFLGDLTPFVWRKHLDFAAIQDAHDMRLRIREHKKLHGPITLPGHNMKLGRGGIREIEFFTQTRQLIAGGRDPDLRQRGTRAGLAALARKGWIGADVAQILDGHYAAHREVEHRLQMLRDAQTHDLPRNAEDFQRLAALMDTTVDTLQSEIRARLEEVHSLTEGFFAPMPDAPHIAGQSEDPTGLSRRWPEYPALRSERALEIFRRLRPEILTKLNSAARPAQAIAAFDGFLAGLPAGVQVFSLLEANPQLIDLLADIVSVSPELAVYLSRNASVFDAVIAGDFFAPWPGCTALVSLLEADLAGHQDYERALDQTRRWTKEWHFRIGVHLLRGLMTADEAGTAYADLAQAVLCAVWPRVQHEFAKRHGAPPGRGAALVGMGSLGAGRLHARSDLDIILIYDAQGQESSEGPKPLETRPYYARLTKALITALTAPMAEGRLYEVDMRLRPSGNQGPVATAWAAFQSYQKQEAWVWEHLALTRARVLVGPPELAAEIDAFRQGLLDTPRDRGEVLQEVQTMRARIQSAKGPGAEWDAKLGQGRMQDIELFAQAQALLSPHTQRGTLDALQHSGLQGADILCASYRHFSRLQQGLRLISGDVSSAEDMGLDAHAFLCRLMQVPDLASLQTEMMRHAAAAAEVIDANLPDLDMQNSSAPGKDPDGKTTKDETG